MENAGKSHTDEHIISVYDIENYVHIIKKLSTAEVFDLMNRIQMITVETVLDRNPLVIKNLGDSNLMIFDKDDIDLTVNTLYDLKGKIEDFLKGRGFAAKASFSSHYGEIAVGTIGVEPFRQTDAFGEELNLAFLLNGKPFRGRFTISPQLFRKLSRETRKRYHKFTPQIVYTAE